MRGIAGDKRACAFFDSGGLDLNRRTRRRSWERHPVGPVGACRPAWGAATELPARLTVKLPSAGSDLARFAATDPLTGLANRRYWDERILALLEPTRRDLGRLGPLQAVQRRAGTSGRDDVLVAFAAAVQQTTPRGDVCALGR